jgi:hypothetical protein
VYYEEILLQSDSPGFLLAVGLQLKKKVEAASTFDIERWLRWSSVKWREK